MDGTSRSLRFFGETRFAPSNVSYSNHMTETTNSQNDSSAGNGWKPELIAELERRRKLARSGGGQARIDKQHASGKLTARERIAILFDPGTFIELNDLMISRVTDFGMDKKAVPGDGVVTGYGKINGRLAFAASQDFTVGGGSLGEYHAKRITHVMDKALEAGAPFISINDSGGARIEEGLDGLLGYSEIFKRNTWASGVIPQIAVIMGPCAGGACYSPAICDFIFMTEKQAQMYITGPAVVKTVTGEEITMEELGGSEVHMEKSGVAHFSYENDRACLEGVRQLLTYLPQNHHEKPAAMQLESADLSGKLQKIIPDNKSIPYDIKEVIQALTDPDSFFEVQPWFALNMVVGFARMNGETIGIVANQPNFMAGAIDYHASDKAARFIRFCDCFNIPLLTLVDVPAFLPGSGQEHNGIIRHGAKLLYAYAEATVAKISLILRKGYGGALLAMNSKTIGADVVFALPTAEMAVMGAEGAVNIVFRKAIQEAENPKSKHAEYVQEYERSFSNPYHAAARGFVDEVILPEESRARIIAAFDMLRNKTQYRPAKKHGNIPL